MKYQTDTKETAVAAFTELGAEVPSDNENFTFEHEGERVDVHFIGAIPVPDTDPVEYVPGFHFDVLSNIRLPFGEEVVELFPENPFHTFI